MKEQKNIERLFQEKFKDFEVTPPEMVWNNIEEKLNEKKKKRRVIPFWFKASGIAASLLLGFYIYNLYNNPSNIDVKNDDNSIVIEDKNNSIPNEKDDNYIEKNQNINDSISKRNSSLTEIENSINNSENIKDNRSTPFKNKKQNNNFLNTEEKFVTSSEKESKENIKKKLDERNQESSFYNKSDIIESDKNKLENTNSSLVKNEIDFEKINKISNDKNSSIVVDKKQYNTTQDSSLVAKISKEVNALEQLLKEKEVGKNVEEKEKEMQNRWAVSSNASPVYFNSSSNGSPLDTRFESNEKNYNNSLSYGVGVSYAINNKISLRTGINTVNLNYNTKEVIFYQDVNAKEIQNLSRNQRGSLINIDNKGTNLNSSSTEVNLFGNEVKKYDGELNQQMGYIEIPFELSYKVLDRKVGIDLIGGMSTLLLNKNDVSLISDGGMEMNIGEANNLNNIHFSSNVGVSFKYLFLKSFEANFNPMFKYQLNTYSENSGNFKPYFIGLYTGLAYKF